MEEKYKQQPSNCVKIVLFGPESTGKTTLSRQLAKHYDAPWVPEYAREYLQKKWDKEQKTCTPEDLLPIAEGQIQLENKLAKTTETVLICDTDLLETKVYSETYYLGTCDPILEKYALENIYSLYFLTYIDTPWIADDLRDKPNDRLRMFKAFEEALIRNKRPYVLLKGDQEERLKKAIKHIDKLLKQETLNFNEDDKKQIEQKGLTLEKVRSQIDTFKTGLPYVNLNSAATLGHGILKVSDSERKLCVNLYNDELETLSIVKFVPASGAATRMFKFLFQFLKDYDPKTESVASYCNNQGTNDVSTFFSNLKELPFYEDVQEKTKVYFKNFEDLSENEKRVAFVKTMLDADKLDLGSNPKGLLPFHNYGNHITTAFEEHLLEGTLYASTQKKARLHYTISEHHKDKFLKKLSDTKSKIEHETGVSFEVSFSYQKASTDTLAVTLSNEPFRLSDGSLHFRPSGHGALIENLSAINADVVFVKNIDNVVVSDHVKVVSDNKIMLAGLLLSIQKQSFKYLEELDKNQVSEASALEIAQFVSSKMNVVLDDDFDDFSLSKKTSYLKQKLNRPIRICGMVKNEGAPGGGPFWVENKDANVSLQIVESAQINQKNEQQKDILNNATHFNPVDLVCGFKDYKGNPFNLTQFVDYNAAFITHKTKDGKDIKALELPGLWNGSMANWNTIFVEVPAETFNPVKTVNDLLKPEHQAS